MHCPVSLTQQDVIADHLLMNDEEHDRKKYTSVGWIESEWMEIDDETEEKDSHCLL